MSVLCIGGTDPLGVSGLAADVKTLTSIGVDASMVVTCVTSQNSSRFFESTVVAAESIASQIRAVFEEKKPLVVKIGLVPTNEAFTAIFRELKGFDGRVVLDPVLVTTSGKGFSLDKKTIRACLPQIDLITPNTDEANTLWGESTADAVDHLTTTSVLLKGGHRLSKGFSSDQLYVVGGQKFLSLASHEWDEVSYRGTGCTLAAAISGFLTRDSSLTEAVVQARCFLNQCANQGDYLVYKSWPQPGCTIPWVGRKWPESPKEKSLGFYLIVDSYLWVERAVHAGVKTLQLRIKEFDSSTERELARSIKLCTDSGVRLYINDFWELAIKHRAYGVHLGQEDLISADIEAIKNANLHLGISTHSFLELAKAHSYSPSYVALGPVFETTLKKMPYAPQGLERISIWKAITNYPVVAIGGLNIERGFEAYRKGADGVAVVSDVLQASEPEKRIHQWLALNG